MPDIAPGITITGRKLLGDTPPKRWTAARKADLLDYIRRGKITREEALRRYEISEAELRGWEGRQKSYGELGLKQKHVQTLPTWGGSRGRS